MDVEFKKEINRHIPEFEWIKDVPLAIKLFKFLDNYVEFEKETDHHFHEWKSIISSIMDDLPESLMVPNDVWGK